MIFSAKFLGLSLNFEEYFIATFEEKSPNFLSLHKFTSILLIEVPAALSILHKDSLIRSVIIFFTRELPNRSQ